MKEQIIDSILNGRLESLASLSISEKKEFDDKIEKVKNDYHINDIVRGLNKIQLDQLENYIDDIKSAMNEVAANLNEKYYRYGVFDGMNITLETFKIKGEIERRFRNVK